jgi:TPR repeat protein
VSHQDCIVLRRGDLGGACKYWRKAAKAGVATGMFKLGLHLYKGDVHALGRNAEDALMWLNRFVAASEAQVRYCLGSSWECN